jgi:hypothetical protein
MATQTKPGADDLKRFLDTAERALAWGGTTPGVLRLALGTVWVLALLFFLVLVVGAGQHRAALKTIADDATPSVLTAQRIKASLADMDSDAANELLGKPGANPQALKAYEDRRLQVDTSLISAAKNITYREESAFIGQVLNQLGPYEEAIARARLLHQQQNDAEAVKQYRLADEIMHRQPGDLEKDRGKILDPDRDADTIQRLGLLAAAEQLDRVNLRELDSMYNSRTSEPHATIWFRSGEMLILGFLLATLVGLQQFLYRRMHRILNPALLAATALAVGLWVYASLSFGAVSGSLRTAKTDAFDSLHFLWRARADAYDANGEESRWLLAAPTDPRQAEGYEKAFQEKAGRLVKGYLADELKNITFPGERAAAEETVAKFDRYLALDAQIRKLQNEGKHDEAVRLCIGYKPDESNWAFDQFDTALGKTIDINQHAFDDAIARGKAKLAWFDVAAAVVNLAVAGLALAGLWPRLQEYAV